MSLSSSVHSEMPTECKAKEGNSPGSGSILDLSKQSGAHVIYAFIYLFIKSGLCGLY